MYGMIAHVAGWGYDQWLDINNPDPDLRDPDGGPSRHEVLLVRTWPERPDDGAVARELEQLRADHLEQADGHQELHSHAIVDEAQWREAIASIGRNDDGMRSIVSRLHDGVDALAYDLGCAEARALVRSFGAAVVPTPRDALPDDHAATIRYW